MKFKELKTNEITYSEIKVNETVIKVANYISAKDKYDFIEGILQEAREDDGSYNDFKVNTLFELYLVFMYTDIEFEDEDREDLLALYDALYLGGYIAAVSKAVPAEEYDFLVKMIGDMRDAREAQSRGVIGALSNFIETLPQKMEGIKELAQNFNPEDFKEVMAFATAANGGRPIPKE